MRRPLPVVRVDPSCVVKRVSRVVRLDSGLDGRVAGTPREVLDNAFPLRRAHSVLVIKNVDDGEGLVTGIATTPTSDLVGDELDPRGAVYKLPLPFLLGHNTAQPLGHVVAAEVTSKGIAISAKVATHVDVPFIREAWALLRAGLIGGLSVGFRGLDVEPIKGTSGLRYKRWLLMEVSAVVLPANSDANIVSVRACDRVFTAADYAASSQSPEVTAILKARAEVQRRVRSKESLSIMSID